ncbi:MAG: hypothetical protein KDB27_09635 [Planctomycetales bacterium]|nr:hypothetical protein [Planctomycetales bacterium]
MPDYQSLNDNPASILDYLKTNVIASGKLQNSKVKNTPEHIVFEHTEYPSGQVDGSAADVHYLKNSDETSPAKSVKAFICDYTKNDVESCILDHRKAKFCFTITMNGCTFGVGIPGEDGTLMVTHANTGGLTTEQRQQTFDTHETSNVALMEPALYRHMADKLTATTFGFWSGSEWKFYFQLYQPSGGVFKAIGTFPIPGQSFVH